MTQEISDAEKGRKFEAEVQRFVEEVVGENPDIKVRSRLSLPGLSARWTSDIVILGRSLLTNEFTMCLVIISCKRVKEGAAPSTYWTEMTRAYMELNDLKLNSELLNPRFFMVVNRQCMKGETHKNYPILFKNIGVELINFNDDAELDEFGKQLRGLLLEAKPSKQIDRLKEVLERTPKTQP